MSDRPVFTVPVASPSGTRRYEYATEEETLEFCNRVREAGGVHLLKALLPGDPGASHSCLLANNLNYGTYVNGVGNTGEPVCINFSLEVANLSKVEKIAEALGLQPAGWLQELDDLTREHIRAYHLPEHIGNVARAFDHGKGWTVKYRA